MPEAGAKWQFLTVIPVRDHNFTVVIKSDHKCANPLIIHCFLPFCRVAQHNSDLTAIDAGMVANLQRSRLLTRTRSYRLGKIDRNRDWDDIKVVNTVSFAVGQPGDAG
jgi:hypothetical protein